MAGRFRSYKAAILYIFLTILLVLLHFLGLSCLVYLYRILNIRAGQLKCDLSSNVSHESDTGEIKG